MLRTVPAAAALPRLRAALDDGEPFAPLSTDPAEAERTRQMLQPDVPLGEPDVAVVLATSGSTGVPKGVMLSRRAIVASARATHARLGGPGDWLLALPAHYVAGLMVLARTVVADTELTEVGSDLAGLPAAVTGSSRRRYLSIVPTQLIRALADPKLTAALTRVDAVLLGGAAAPPALVQQARTAGVSIVTTYGMSETCGGCVYDGRPLDGVDVRVGTGGEDGADGDGRIRIGGPVVFSGYRLRPDLSAEALDADGGFRTRDLGRLVDGRLEVLGRSDDVVITGGLNVHLGEVERALTAAPELAGAESAVVAVPDDEWGSRLIAVTDHREVDRSELAGRLRSQLPQHAVPRVLLCVASLPRTSSGKVDRQRLRSGVTMDLSLDPGIAERNRLR